ncbi:hypothetical protein BBM86_22700 [Vibrio parahaemolyticus]|uniref:hypothetical protein n=1 Tax=Vibrio parahaemolyticus TaxID=670 RepID=UPI00084A4EE3|nr:MULTISPECIES: hypothetical protein [Vibrio]EJS4061504.1 hypothetical protein [Vibrio parahaemolyticus]OEB77172.1 hypothetical protein BBM86_22700 [Vibrio parahaemolyticus]PMJ92810.1 hypothetical protein BCU11_21405 [Vibrio cyclitrophicus]
MATIYASFTTLEKQSEVINQRVIPRMREIDLCGKVSKHMLDSDCFDGVKSFSTASLNLGGVEFYSGVHSRQLTDPILDTGITMIRAMLQFFHVGVHVSGNFQRYKGHHDGNIVIDSFQIQKPDRNPDSSNYLWQCLDSSEIEALRIVAINGNKGVAHLTEHRTVSISLAQLSEASFAINKLLNHWLVKPKLGFDAQFNSVN